MLEDVLFISMEGKGESKIENFSIREDIPLPVFIENGKKVSLEDITAENIITGIIKVLIEDPNNDNLDYYRDFIFTVQPMIEARLSSVAYEAEKHGDYNDALEMYRILYILNPDSLETNLNIAICYDEYSQKLFQNGREEEAAKIEEQAFEFYKKVDDFDDKPDKVYYYIGRFYLIKENYEKAVEYFNTFLEETKDDEKKKEVLTLLNDINIEGIRDEDYQMAIELIQSGKENDALEFIEKFISKHPNSWNAYYIKGVALSKLGEYSDAIGFFEKALKYNPGSSDIYNEIGLCYVELGIYHKGEMNFYRALKKKPDDISILSNLAICSYKKGNKKEAVKYCEIILEYYPKDPKIKDLKKVIEESNI